MIQGPIPPPFQVNSKMPTDTEESRIGLLALVLLGVFEDRPWHPAVEDGGGGNRLALLFLISKFQSSRKPQQSREALSRAIMTLGFGLTCVIQWHCVVWIFTYSCIKQFSCKFGRQISLLLVCCMDTYAQTIRHDRRLKWTHPSLPRSLSLSPSSPPARSFCKRRKHLCFNEWQQS